MWKRVDRAGVDVKKKIIHYTKEYGVGIPTFLFIAVLIRVCASVPAVVGLNRLGGGDGGGGLRRALVQ